MYVVGLFVYFVMVIFFDLISKFGLPCSLFYCENTLLVKNVIRNARPEVCVFTRIINYLLS